MDFRYGSIVFGRFTKVTHEAIKFFGGGEAEEAIVGTASLKTAVTIREYIVYIIGYARILIDLVPGVCKGRHSFVGEISAESVLGLLACLV